MENVLLLKSIYYDKDIESEIIKEIRKKIRWLPDKL